MSDEVVIVPYPDGPYVVRGTFNLRDHEGATIETNRRTVALCRCGKSRLRPFCDGTHQLIRFQAASGRENARVSKPRQVVAQPRPVAAQPSGLRWTNGHGSDQPAHRHGSEQIANRQGSALPAHDHGFNRSVDDDGTDSLQPQRRSVDARGSGDPPGQIASIRQDLSRVQRNLAQVLDASGAGKDDSIVAEAAALLGAAATLLGSGDGDG